MLLQAITSGQVIRALHRAGFKDGKKHDGVMDLWNPMTGARTYVPLTKEDERPFLRGILRRAKVRMAEFRDLL